ncbi:MAG: hypothetical protein ABGZ53_24655 [Fuerstiella sp.]
MSRTLFCAAALFALSGLAAVPAADLTEEEFRQLHAELQPAKDALWRTVPWKTSVLDAQQVAAKEKKPLFIWAMDGHPLGCT